MAMEINFYFSNEARKRLTWEDLETVELMGEGEVSARGLRNLAARFMVDADNKYLSEKQAKQILGKLTQEEIEAVLKRFTEALQEAAVPNPSGGSLKPPSEASTPASEFPAGSES